VRLLGEPASAPGPAARVTHAVHNVAPPSLTTSTSHPHRRTAMIAAAAAGLLAAAGLAGWLSGRTGGSTELASMPAAATASSPATSASPAASPATSASPGTSGSPGTSASPAASPAPSASVPEWTRLLDELDAHRAEAFAAADPALLMQVYAPTSPLLPTDRAAIARLRAAGQTAKRVRHTVRKSTTTSYDGERAVLRVVDALSSYDVMSAGRVVQRGAPRGDATFVVTLVRTARGWRLLEVSPA
jgi:hypothetical protein